MGALISSLPRWHHKQEAGSCGWVQARHREEGVGSLIQAVSPQLAPTWLGAPREGQGSCECAPRVPLFLRPLQRAFRDLIPSGFHTLLHSSIKINLSD